MKPAKKYAKAIRWRTPSILKEDQSQSWRINGNAFNFGPNLNYNYNVIDLVKELSLGWEEARWEIDKNIEKTFKESNLLKLNCDKAMHLLGWRPSLDFERTIQYTSDWYKNFYKKPNVNSLKLCNEQILKYTNYSKKIGNKWI